MRIKPSLLSLVIVVTAFLSSTAIGYLRAPDFTEKDSIIFRSPLHHLKESDYFREQKSMDERHKKFWKFIKTNFQVELFTLAVGTAFFIYPSIHIALLGFIIGVLYWHIGSFTFFMRLMLPHSLTEIPTALYCCAMAQSSGWKWLVSPTNRWICFKKEFMSNLKLGVFIIFPLVIINALLEAYVTCRRF